MATALVKGLAAIGALGTASGAGALVYLNTGTKISDKLTSSGFKLISDEDDYKIHLFAYKTDAKLQRAIGETTLDHTKHLSKLKKWCDDNLNKWASNDKDNVIFDNAKVWCVVPEIKILGDKVKGTFHDDSEWKGKYAGFVATDDKSKFLAALKKHFSDVNFDARDFDGGPKLKEWCEKVKIINTYDVDEHKSEDNFKAWCIKAET